MPMPDARLVFALGDRSLRPRLREPGTRGHRARSTGRTGFSQAGGSERGGERHDSRQRSPDPGAPPGRSAAGLRQDALRLDPPRTERCPAGSASCGSAARCRSGNPSPSPARAAPSGTPSSPAATSAWTETRRRSTKTIRRCQAPSVRTERVEPVAASVRRVARRLPLLEDARAAEQRMREWDLPEHLQRLEQARSGGKLDALLVGVDLTPATGKPMDSARAYPRRSTSRVVACRRSRPWPTAPRSRLKGARGS